ncbi:AAA family ATPase [Donghicola eburneus]|uniref:AAA family ATPase n=1 Tax=Donghicola eburneus TaxID=393278 RepID=UPI0008DF3A09|nr:AAA family ATPase [Donghicola eburneus]SFQ78928.1 Wobble nucleotide-excising tRNase [Donghicola eburneus]
MLKKIISVKNVGRFRNSATSPNPQLGKHTFIAGANGYGKTTLCAVLRSLQTGDPAHVLGRKTLGATDASTVELLLDDGQARFDGVAWNATKPEISIFDGVFVAENVHSGEVVDIEHKRNLYRVIVGDAGVKLAAQDADLAAESRAKTGEISTAGKAVQPHVPAAMKLDAFISLPETSDIAVQIEAQTRSVDALRQADALRARPVLSEFAIPALPEEFTGMLARTIDDIAQDAEQRLSEHLAAHCMTASGGNWIADGLGHADDTCPFCGQDIRALPLIAAFRAVFSERYEALAGEIATMNAGVLRDMGDAALARLNTIAEQNNGGVEFWQKYCAIEAPALSLPTEAVEAIRGLAAAATCLLDRKAAVPLELITPDEGFTVARTAYDSAAAAIEAANIAIRAANVVIADKKAAADAGDLKAAETELARLTAIQTRHRADVSELCGTYTKLCGEKDGIEARKDAIRKQLDAHTRTVVKPYERRINDYLAAFNAGFTITETKHAYPGGVATSSYQLVINDTAIDLGDSKTPGDRPSFKNTLSAGDRTTLALAFFLAHLERDPAAAGKLVVFDDPFNSQDAFRRRQTVHEIMKVAGKCAQVIVLSHDATFLKQVWDKSPAAERVALTIADHRAQGSKIMPVDLEHACRGRTATDIDDLQTYLSTGAGNLLDIIRKMRVVLETHCRTTYPGSFLANDWLGDIVRKIREGGDPHPAQALYDELDQINGYTSQYHHGEDMDDATPDQIDPSELTGFTRRTLRIVNALQA